MNRVTRAFKVEIKKSSPGRIARHPAQRMPSSPRRSEEGSRKLNALAAAERLFSTGAVNK